MGPCGRLRGHDFRQTAVSIVTMSIVKLGARMCTLAPNVAGMAVHCARSVQTTRVSISVTSATILFYHDDGEACCNYQRYGNPKFGMLKENYAKGDRLFEQSRKSGVLERAIAQASAPGGFFEQTRNTGVLERTHAEASAPGGFFERANPVSWNVNLLERPRGPRSRASRKTGHRTSVATPIL